MKAPRRPVDEARRLESLRRYDLLDTPPELALDELAALAAHLCEAPIGLISLIDEERQWFKSRVGFPVREIPRDISFCGHAILQPELFVVADARTDERFADNPLVIADPHIQSYAGVPLVTAEGHAIGTLCVMDRKARALHPSQQETLRLLSRQVMAYLELRCLTHDGTGGDLAARKQAEITSGRLAAIVESSDDAIIGKDLNGRITSWNRGAERMFGYTSGEMVGTSIMGLIPADRQAEEAHILERIRSGQDVEHLETLRQTKDGRLIDVSITASPIRDDRGTVVGVSKIARNVTDRMRTESRFRRLVDSNVQGVMFWNAAGEITGANDAFLRIVGYTRDDLLAGSIRGTAISPPEFAEVDRRSRGEIASRGVCAPYEKEYLRKDGSRVPVLIGAAAFEDSPDEGVCFVLDLTAHKKLEHQVLRVQRMESIGTVAGGIAHDLNNVLAPILMGIELVRDTVTDADGLSFLNMMRRSAEHGADLVKQLLTFARGVEGQRAPVDLGRLIDDVLKVMRDTFPKTINVRFEPPPGVWTVTGDSTQLHQVILNLCVNARDAMPSGGNITIGIENAVLDETYAMMNLDARPGAYVKLRVEDTGQGIPVAIRDRIFEPFFTTKDIGEGTGLGLSTTMGIVKSHGGFIHLYSEVGLGTKFEVYLPAVTNDAAAEIVAIEQTGLPRGNGELVLVVDDEDAICKIVQATLERFGYRVMLAANGAEAVARFVQHRTEVAVVLTDMAMPVMDGAATMVALKAIDPSLRIIGSSGLGPSGAMTMALGAGIRHFVAKPYTAEAILKTLQQILREDRRE